MTNNPSTLMTDEKLAMGYPASVTQAMRTAIREMAQVGLLVREIVVDVNCPDKVHPDRTTITILDAEKC